nr:immunoglobulin light chain junction region [Macaca mulatta]MOX07569.1 immunoglobulin light chain junction region [Macaca mulatta]MOX07734.1 immunoglobulin light chain junction region [Macaca mulatta]MOX08276.1 immunoglobulin light chain junction region [Macaca mulatta]MOX08332.1 immunoglobulin light chain junction region [Macaca mulatta]
CLQYNSSPWTF